VEAGALVFDYSWHRASDVSYVNTMQEWVPLATLKKEWAEAVMLACDLVARPLFSDCITCAMQEWVPLVDVKRKEWMDSVALVFDYFRERTPRSFVEPREASIVWNYRSADIEFGRLQVGLGFRVHVQSY